MRWSASQRGHGGSEMSGDVRNVYVYDCVQVRAGTTADGSWIFLELRRAPVRPDRARSLRSVVDWEPVRLGRTSRATPWS
jgi:hypothetical protein